MKWVVGKVNDIHNCDRTELFPDHRNATAKLLGHLLVPKMGDPSRVYKPKDIINDIILAYNIDISYKKAWGGRNIALESLSGCPKNSFSQLLYFCYNLKVKNPGWVTHIETDDEDRFEMVFIAFGVAIRAFLDHLRPLIIIDAAHVKGTYLGTNMLAIGMDGNNQIVPLATGVSQGETGRSWTWFLTHLKECIGEVPDLAIISDRHLGIQQACQTVYPEAFHGFCCRHLMLNCKFGTSERLKALYWKACKCYTTDEFTHAFAQIERQSPEAHQKLFEAGVRFKSMAYCTGKCYNYMTSNSAESINNSTRHVRRSPISMLMEYYRGLVQEWFYARAGDLSDWASAKVKDRVFKSANWTVKAIEHRWIYEVYDRRKKHIVKFRENTCTCRKWQLSGLPCGHAIAACRFQGMTSCNHLAKRWFRTTTLKATYQALIYPLGEYNSWELPTNLQVVKPPSMVKPQSGRPKNKDRIRSQGEEPRENSCQRCGSGAHTRGECSAPLPKNKKAKKRQIRATIYLQRLPQYPGGSSQGSQPSMSQSYHLDNMPDP
ncbi:transposase, MuDR, MULE transposase domain protein [Artemisia annua]|uniref:Transposase, MuDR, MULE transposase domain protein n=1 Tax=Artemisia annua TaxID=35608 RepID=A0A2U1PYI2_ARTAN|nr:transposase, MuDR, MULE transposase domain protein [Artemisia annua]